MISKEEALASTKVSVGWMEVRPEKSPVILKLFMDMANLCTTGHRIIYHTHLEGIILSIYFKVDMEQDTHFNQRLKRIFKILVVFLNVLFLTIHIKGLNNVSIPNVLERIDFVLQRMMHWNHKEFLCLAVLTL